MQIETVKQILKETDSFRLLEELIMDEIHQSSQYDQNALKGFKEKTGLDFDFVKSYRGDSGDHDTYIWIFKLNDKFYRVFGWHSSWDGSEMDDIEDFHEVKKVARTTEVWEGVN